MKNLKTIEKEFKDKKLLKQALTHRSWVNENKGLRNTNERLEYLGDAILEFVVSKEIFKKYPKKEEGYLTALRANLVNTTNLSRIAKKLKVGEKLFLSKGEEEGGGRENESLLADTVEAIIGAIFVDRGLKSTTEFIRTNILSDVEEISKKPLKDSKSTLQEMVQAKGLPAPRYETKSETGPDHNKTFEVEVLVNSKLLATGRGKSKNIAAQDAARIAVKKLETEQKQG